jgi:hypothetical protein
MIVHLVPLNTFQRNLFNFICKQVNYEKTKNTAISS